LVEETGVVNDFAERVAADTAGRVLKGLGVAMAVYDAQKELSAFRVKYVPKGWTPGQEATKELRKVAQWLRDNPSRTVVLTGTANSEEVLSVGYDLALERANVARKQLLDEGISPDRITVRSGKALPELAPEENRNVRFSLGVEQQVAVR
jgi:hypothetical protein